MSDSVALEKFCKCTLKYENRYMIICNIFSCMELEIFLWHWCTDYVFKLWSQYMRPQGKACHLEVADQ